MTYSKIIIYYLSAFVMFVLLGIASFQNDYLYVNIYVLIQGIAFAFVLYEVNRLVEVYNLTKLLIIIFIYSFVFIFLNNCISYIVRENFFVFSEADASVYDYIASEAVHSNQGVLDALKFLGYTKFGLEDYGAVHMVYWIYNIYPSNLTLNFFYIILNMGTAYILFRLCKNFMNDKYSFLCTLTFAISSFTVWISSTGLKEPMLLFIVLSSFTMIFEFSVKKNPVHLILGISLLSLLTFFRPAIIIFIVVAILLMNLFYVKRMIFKIFIMMISIAGIAYGFNYLQAQKDRYIPYNSAQEFFESSENLKQGASVQLGYSTHIVSAVVGPMTTFAFSEKDFRLFLSSGLLLKSILTFPLLMGFYYIYKTKQRELYGVVFIALIEMLSLILILEAIEFRKSFPHLPFLYVIAFWFIYIVNEKKQIGTPIRFNVDKAFKISYFIIVLFLLVWNFRKTMI